MIDQQERIITPTAGAAELAALDTPNVRDHGPPSPPEVVAPVSAGTEVAPTEHVNGEQHNGVEEERRQWHVEAGRKGAHRVHQLIQEGKLYEKEHGLKRGRQRLRQLLELGKLYEQEHGLQPGRPQKGGKRLSRMERAKLLGTFLQCLLRIAKPSFRAELLRLTQVLQEQTDDSAA
jgi:hypothetical protein